MRTPAWSSPSTSDRRRSGCTGDHAVASVHPATDAGRRGLAQRYALSSIPHGSCPGLIRRPLIACGMIRSQFPCSPGAQGCTPTAWVRATRSARCSGPTSSARPRTSTLQPPAVGSVEVVHLEGDVGVRRGRQGRPRVGPDDDGPPVHPVVDRDDQRLVPGEQTDATDLLCGQQLVALVDGDHVEGSGSARHAAHPDRPSRASHPDAGTAVLYLQPQGDVLLQTRPSLVPPAGEVTAHREGAGTAGQPGPAGRDGVPAPAPEAAGTCPAGQYG